MVDDRDAGAVAGIAGTVDDSAHDAVHDDRADPAASTVDVGTRAGTDAAAPRLRPGTKIGRYEIVKTLGSGGMGIVYLAYDPTLDRSVALKLLRSELRTAQARLLREGQSAARLAHPNVVRVFDIGTDGDDLFIAMEYVDGQTLGQWFASERRPARAVLELVTAAGRGLAAAHRAGIVHRDFKPDNVLIGRDGRVLVTDFGLARLETPSGSGADDAETDAARRWPAMTLTRTGGVLGTPAYMAPEQLRGQLADARSDQFSFCVACWEGVFGSRPFALPAKGTLDDVRRAVEAGIVEREPVPKSLATIERALRRGLSPDPAARFPDIDALLAELAPRGSSSPTARMPFASSISRPAPCATWSTILPAWCTGSRGSPTPATSCSSPVRP